MGRSNLRKCELAKSHLASVYKSEAEDETFDNGLLTALNNAILNVEEAISFIKKRTQ